MSGSGAPSRPRLEALDKPGELALAKALNCGVAKKARRSKKHCFWSYSGSSSLREAGTA